MSLTSEGQSTDEERLAELGYKQELNRGWSRFSNFAISFSIISVLAGCFTTYGQAFNNGGPVAISIAWPVISAIILIGVALPMAELASAMPTSGGIYYWASKLAGPGWGWFTGWFNLIGLVAGTASVVYVSSVFLVTLLGLSNVDFVFNFGSTNAHYIAHVEFAMFALILIVDGLINVFRSHLVSLFTGISVWWHVLGVAAIVGILIFGPIHHASISYVFTHTINNSGFKAGSTHVPFFWLYVLPVGFLLTMYTITGYDASAHISEETHDAAQSAPRGLWRSVFYSAAIGWIVLLAITFAIQRSKESTILHSGYPSLAIFETALSSTAAKVVILISTVGQLFCGMAIVTSASRMTFAFSRDGAVPGHALWRRLGKNRAPTWSVLFVIVFAFVLTIPAYFPNSLGTPVAFLAVTSIATISLYIAYVTPVFLRWRKGKEFAAGPWTLGGKYKWMNIVGTVWVAICVVIFVLPFTPTGVPWNSGFSLNFFNYALPVTVVVFVGVVGWYQLSAKKWFKGPVRTIDEPDAGPLPGVGTMP
ncbi:MAG TPA: amino acid permease [Solirubrobacteraceae bacterium]|nr:amino acid permease [Solirubrobacteraceae bacterium]